MSKITKIAKIDNFGIFKNFDWDSSLSHQNKKGENEVYNFKDINIFYGRNYSGKTSLSKIIRALEIKSISSKYENPNFRIKLDDDSEITPSNLSNFQHPIHVYNSDFLRENLKFLHNEDENIESFSVTLGGDNQQTLQRIKELKSQLGSNDENSKSGFFLDIQNKANELRDSAINHQNKKQFLEKLLTDKATKNSDSIKNQHERFGNIRYDKRSLDTDISEVQKSSYQHLTSDQIQSFENIIQQRELSDPLELPTFNLNFASLVNSTAVILKTIVGSSKKIEELVNNSDLHKWVETGHPLHKDRNTCAFCNNEISATRREELQNHFDQETQKLQSKISEKIQDLDRLLIGNEFKVNFNIQHYYQQYHTYLLQLSTELQAILDKQKISIEKLKKLLEQKNGKLFTEVEVEYPDDHSDKINAVLNKISQIRFECIQLNSELTAKQKEAKNELRLNHVYQFVHNINYSQLKADIETAFDAIDPLQRQLDELKTRKSEIENQIKEEEAKLKSEGEACRQINEILQHDFGHQHLSLEPLETTSTNSQSIKFEIQRLKNGIKTKAHNLSEGECSLISFCYFLAKVQESLSSGQEPIIWIDDPICSLDSNHIFFIFSLIEEKICKEKKFSQLFISTHNIEFLKYLRRIQGVESDNAIGQVGELKRKAGYFLIQRHDNFSTIRQMPLYLSKFLTEFNFLFDQIYKCATVNQIDDSNFHIFYNFGNNARKFLEIYTFYKFPSPTYQLDNQLKTFWGEQIHKTLTDRIHNEYSHMTGVLERGETISEQPEMQKSAKAIINKVQEVDIIQYNALLESINISIQNDSLHPSHQTL